jgi:hypothetical protein
MSTNRPRKAVTTNVSYPNQWHWTLCLPPIILNPDLFILNRQNQEIRCQIGKLHYRRRGNSSCKKEW